jgi:thiamine transport system substrate-binding protein
MPAEGAMKTTRIVYFVNLFVGFVLVFSFFTSCRKEKAQSKTDNLVIWTYDSFNSEWGPGPEVSKAFEEKTGIKIEWVSHGDAGTILSRLLLEGKEADADIILGIDQNMAGRILESNLMEPYRPKGAENIFPELILDPEFRLTPMDYSYFAIVYDSEKITSAPDSLEELTDPNFAGSLILIDPRTSSPGLGFFVWVKEVYGSSWREYWRRLKPSILTIAEGWSSAYGLFTGGEAPLVLSYTTSPGYHLEYENSERYKAAIFKDGHILQIEAAGILKSAKNSYNARLFLDFMLDPVFQNIIPLTNWMYTVTNVPLPDSFRVNPKSGKPLKGSPVTEEELNEWAALMLNN